jgi:hypothetical protein
MAHARIIESFYRKNYIIFIIFTDIFFIIIL